MEDTKERVVVDVPRVKNKPLKALENLKHQALLNAAYSAGLKVSEIVSLKVKDIDADPSVLRL